ncbi:MUC5A protein, partial [Anseranas semipalmata]|nr:MUC5A protein [Anseranas semipalmata]
DCEWTDWIDVSSPNSSDVNSGDYETFENILQHNPSWECLKAENISCRAEKYANISLEDLGQKVECNVNTGLICNNKDQVNNSNTPYCHNYEISICCIPHPECIPSTEYRTSMPTTVYTTTSTVFTTTVSTTTAPPTSTSGPSSTTSGTTVSSSTPRTTSVSSP